MDNSIFQHQQSYSVVRKDESTDKWVPVTLGEPSRFRNYGPTSIIYALKIILEKVGGTVCAGGQGG